MEIITKKEAIIIMASGGRVLDEEGDECRYNEEKGVVLSNGRTVQADKLWLEV